MRVLLAASEAVPFAKTGGLADVTAGLAKALAAKGVETALVIPCYRKVRACGIEIRSLERRLSVPMRGRIARAAIYRALLPGSKVPVYLVRHDGFFGREGIYSSGGSDYPDNALRFAFFSRAIVEMILKLHLRIDVLHLHDWHTAPAAVYLNHIAQHSEEAARTKTLLAIHNLAYQGIFSKPQARAAGLPGGPRARQAFEFYGNVNFLKGGLIFADRLSTVSPTYAKEICTTDLGYGLEDILRERGNELAGILNGIDVNTWSPETDALIAQRYDSRDLAGKDRCKKALWKSQNLSGSAQQPLIGMVVRLDQQKGLDIAADAIERILDLPAKVVLLGTGDPHYERIFAGLSARRKGELAVNLQFDEKLAHRIHAGSDMLLVPSRREPCGLSQMHALRYGTIPIVRATGGLADTIVDAAKADPPKGRARAFAFTRYTAAALLRCAGRAVRLYADTRRWRALVRRAMSADHGWTNAADAYLKLYEEMRDRRTGDPQ